MRRFGLSYSAIAVVLALAFGLAACAGGPQIQPCPNAKGIHQNHSGCNVGNSTGPSRGGAGNGGQNGGGEGGEGGGE